MSRLRRLLRPRVLLPVGVAGVAVLTAALLVFEPWKLVTNDVVDGAFPVATTLALPPDDGGIPVASAPAASSSPPVTSKPSATARPSATPNPSPTSKSSAAAGTSAAPEYSGSAVPPPTTSAAPAQPVVLATGRFISHEHGTSGSARILRLADGGRVLRIEGLDTSNGPDLHVWLSDAPVTAGRDGWYVFDDGAYVDLGELKGNRGNQNYTIPISADLKQLTSVTVWCERFSVSFGAAALV